MKHVKAETILPENLVKEIQKYVQGEYLYIPAGPDTRKKWGENSGNRSYIQTRNEDIRNRYMSGHKITYLAEEFFLSVDSIKKIVYAKSK